VTLLVLTSFALIVLTIVVHAVGTNKWLRFLVGRYAGSDGQFKPSTRLTILIATALVLIGLHLVEILLWALTYIVVAPGELGSLEPALYFSAVTFTSLGYGDITLSSQWRILSGIEAINGILLIGWTTAFLFAVLQRTWVPLAEIQNKKGGNKDE
jgi:voltage-gated potassium channel